MTTDFVVLSFFRLIIQYALGLCPGHTVTFLFPVSPSSSRTWRNVMHTVRSIMRTGWNSIEWQEVGIVPVCIAECEHVTEMIRELSCVINGFSMTEITDILAYLSTN